MTDRPALRPAQVSAPLSQHTQLLQYLLRTERISSTSCGCTSAGVSSETQNAMVTTPNGSAEPRLSLTQKRGRKLGEDAAASFSHWFKGQWRHRGEEPHDLKDRAE